MSFSIFVSKHYITATEKEYVGMKLNNCILNLNNYADTEKQLQYRFLEAKPKLPMVPNRVH